MVDGNLTIWGSLETWGAFTGFFILIIVILTIIGILFIGCSIWCLYRFLCVRRVELTVKDETKDDRGIKKNKF